MPIRKTEFPIIKRDVNETYIALRLTDGYVNASALCEACDKNLDDYIRLKTTDEFMKELSKEINIPVSDLVQPFESRNPYHKRYMGASANGHKPRTVGISQTGGIGSTVGFPMDE